MTPYEQLKSLVAAGRKAVRVDGAAPHPEKIYGYNTAINEMIERLKNE